MRQSVVFRLAFISLCVTVFQPYLLELPELKSHGSKVPWLRPIVSDIAVVAHRGASEYGPENSLAAYKQAIMMNADFIELDLQMTKDGYPIVMHDESLNRTTNAKKLYPDRSPWLVRDFSLEEIRTLDAGSWFNQVYKKKAKQEYMQQRVPTFQEVIQFVRQKGKGEVGLFIELKMPQANPGIEEKVIDILRNKDFLNPNKLIFGSISEESLRKLKVLAPNIKRVQLYKRGMLESINLKKEFERIAEYASGVGPNKELVTPELIEAAHQSGLFIQPWTVNEQSDMAELLSLGVDGEITNKPDHFAQLRDLFKCSNNPGCT